MIYPVALRMTLATGIHGKSLGGEEVRRRYSRPKSPMTVLSGEINRAIWAPLLHLLSERLELRLFPCPIYVIFTSLHIFFFVDKYYFATSSLSCHRLWLALQIIPSLKPLKLVHGCAHDPNCSRGTQSWGVYKPPLH